MASIQGIYIALFGRPADPLGLAFFNEATNEGADLTAIGDLAASAEYQGRFEGLSNVQIINSIYQSLFGRDADLAGLTFFANALQNGSLNINNIAIAILDGAQGDDLATVNNKIAAADAFTAALDTGAEVVAYQGAAAAAAGRDFLAGITADDATIPSDADIDTAIQAIVDADGGVGPGTPGSVFTLTDSTATNVADNITGTANDDTFRAVLINGNNTLETVDTINGGAGFDTLNAQLTNGASTSPVLASIERVNVSVAAGGTATFDGSASSGLQQVWATNVIGGNGSSVLNVTGVSTSVAIGIQDTDAGNDDDLDVNVTFTGVGGSADSANIFVDGADAGSTVTANGIEIFNVNVVSSSELTLNTSAANVGESVVVSGSGNLTLAVGGNLDDQLDTVNASALSGNLSLTAVFNQDATITSGAGADSLSVTGAGDEVLTINSGAGNDTINTGASAAHSITVGAGVDTINLDARTVSNLGADDVLTGAALQAAAVKITDFVSADDTLNIDSTTGTEFTLTGTQMSNVAGEANLLDAINLAVSSAAGWAAGGTIAFEFGGNTYVYVDDAAGGGVDAGDVLIELTGVTGINAADVVVA